MVRLLVTVVKYQATTALQAHPLCSTMGVQSVCHRCHVSIRAQRFQRRNSIAVLFTCFEGGSAGQSLCDCFGLTASVRYRPGAEQPTSYPISAVLVPRNQPSHYEGRQEAEPLRGNFGPLGLVILYCIATGLGGLFQSTIWHVYVMALMPL